MENKVLIEQTSECSCERREPYKDINCTGVVCRKCLKQFHNGSDTPISQMKYHPQGFTILNT